MEHAPTTSSPLARTATVRILDVRCRGDDHRHEECVAEDQVVFVRKGVFEWFDAAGRTLADTGSALVVPAGTPYRVSHPLDGGDRCTSIAVSGTARREIVTLEDSGTIGGRERRGHAAARVLPPRAHILHRALLAAIAGNPRDRVRDTLGIEETALTLVWIAVRGARALRSRGRPSAARVETAEAHRDLVRRARVEMARNLDSPLSLTDLARRVGASPFHLCRVFRDREGLPLHRYRTRLRLVSGLEQMLDGKRLIDIALAEGFSSHAHFTASFAREFGVPPSRALASDARQTSKILKASARPAR